MAIPMINKFVRQKSKILKVIDVTSDVKEITFEQPEGEDYIPGQFVGIKINDNKDVAGYRAYSILSDKEGNLQVCVKKVKDGRGSSFLHSRKEGDVLEIIFPLGYFGYQKDLSENVVFIATGTGLVPILSLLENLPDNFNGNAKLIFGVRNEEDLFYEDRINNLTKNNPNISSVVALSQPKDTWKGESGRVTNILDKEKLEKDTQFFICGNGQMISSVREMLEEKGMKNGDVFYEDFNE